MATIDVDALRAYLLDYCGTAAFNGFPAAIMDAWDIENASGEVLCREAERLGVDLCRFVVVDSSDRAEYESSLLAEAVSYRAGNMQASSLDEVERRYGLAEDDI